MNDTPPPTLEQALTRLVRPGASTIVGEPGRWAAADATYINATYGHGFEYDDFAGNAHPGCCVVPAALAIGEEVGATLGQMLVAMAAGYEAYVRIGRLGSPDLLNAGWQPRNIEELQYSLPVQMALAALGLGNGYRTHLHFLEGRLALQPESDVIRLARTMTLQVATELDDRYPLRFVADVTAHYRDGSSQHVFIDRVPGRNGAPYTSAQHQAKLDELTTGVIWAERSARLYALIDDFDPATPVAALTALLRPQ